ncbi:MAG: OadG family transporter subunit [Verrucomicrobiota bacterium]
MLFLAASLAEHPTLLENLRYQTVGLIVVLSTLASLWLILEILAFVFRRIKIQDAPQQSEEEDTDCPLEDVSPEVVAVIAAAVESVIQQPHRIASVQAVQIAHDHAHGQAWALEGRRHIHATRGVR